MYAVFIEVNADDSHAEQARKALPELAVPSAREQGARGGYFLAPQNGRGISVTVYDDESAARSAAVGFTVGEPVGLVDGVTVRTVEIREVFAEV